jgi:hypothetical protein
MVAHNGDGLTHLWCTPQSKEGKHMGSIVSIEWDPKTSKSVEQGYITGITYLGHHKTSGFNVCNDATPGCSRECLEYAGRGSMKPTQIARIKRTLFLFQHRAEYFLQAEREWESLIRQADRRKLIPVGRPNGTSDLPYERMPFTGKSGRRYGSLMERFPDGRDIFWMDYTKNPTRAREQPYNLTFSRAETPTNQAHALELLDQGINIAVVFGVPSRADKFGHKKPLPETWEGHTVIDGDLHDLRFLDPRGVVVGLRSKGTALHDKTGFVIPVEFSIDDHGEERAVVVYTTRKEGK